MKTDALTANILNGDLLMVVTYHAAKAEEVTYRSKTTKQVEKFSSLRHSCLTATGIAVWSERLPDGFDVAKYKSPYKSGDRLVIKVTSMQNSQGVVTISGTGELLEK